MGARSGPWDHNIHYHRFLLRQVPRNAERALDVGCGEGHFARALAERFAHVEAIDASPEMVTAAERAFGSVPNLRFRVGDITRGDVEQSSFDFVSALAVVHHLPFEGALLTLASLVRRGGTLAVLGLYDERTPLDYAFASVAVVANRYQHRRRGGERDYPAPTAAPTMGLAEIKQRAGRTLPGARVRRHLLWRYSLVWRSG